MLSTMIHRIPDNLPLAASVDDEGEDTNLLQAKNNGKTIFRKLTESSEPACTIESGSYALHYIIARSIAYLVIVDKSYPRKLAFSYLDELSKEFERSFGEEARKPGLRPYAFVKFDSFIQQTKRLYQDSRTATSKGAGGLDKLNEELQDVSRIMSKNMEDLLWRGDSLDRMSHLSNSLRDESLKYRKAARRINIDALIRQWAPLGVIGLFFLIILWWKLR